MESILAEARTDSLLMLFESAPIGVVVSNEEGGIEMVNACAEAIFGYQRHELLGRSIETLIPQRFRRRHIRHREEYFTAPRARPMGLNMTLMGRRKDGSEFPVEVGLSHLELDGQRLAVSFISDITARVEAEEALRQQASELERRVAERTREIERRQQVAEGLRDVLRVLNTARPLEEILDLIVEQASNLLATDAVAIYRQDDEDGQPRIQAARYANTDRFGNAILSGLSGEFAFQDAGSADSREAQDWRPASQSESQEIGMTHAGRFRSVLAVPLNVKGEVYGSVCLYYRAPRTFSQEEKELAIAFADQAALAIENARLREQVRRSAVAEERNRLA
ncbi:MAG: PAS domain S-box protein, partial [Caldilineae bacterium]